MKTVIVLSRLHDALAMQLEALELDGRVAGVGDLQFDRSVGGGSVRLAGSTAPA